MASATGGPGSGPSRWGGAGEASRRWNTHWCSWRFSLRCLRLRLCGAPGLTGRSFPLPSTPRHTCCLRDSRVHFKTSFCIRARGDAGGWEEGQASVEAAVLLPTLMLLLALLLEPACMGYTRCVMCSAASEAVRVAGTDYDGDFDDCRSFVLRRLRAVPEVPLFHVGGQRDWTVDISGGDGKAQVRISGHVRPLPLVGCLAAAFGESDAQGVVLRAEASGETRPSWVGGTYETWQEVWA